MSETTTRAQREPSTPSGRTSSKNAGKTPGRSTGKGAATQPAKATESPKAPRLPKYVAVAADLRGQITSGHLPPGSVLPTEAELAARHGVSVITVRSAIAELRAEGLITVVHGKGSFVRRRTSDRPSHTHPRAITHTHAMQSGDLSRYRRAPRSGLEDRTEGRAAGSVDGAEDGHSYGYIDADTDDGWWPVEEPATYQTEATAAIALSLGVVEHTPLFGTDRLLEDAAGRRVLHRAYIPMTTVDDAADHEPELAQDPYVAGGRLYSLLADAGHRLTWTEHVTARNPSPDDTNTLRVPHGTPVITTRRITHGTNGHPLALEETHRSADDTQLTYHLTATEDHGHREHGQ